MKRITIFLMTLMLLLGLAVSGHATLIDMHDGTIYDTDTQLSWLKNAAMGGLLSWDSAMTWANNLSFAGFDNWRLPAVVDTGSSGCDFAYSGTDCGYNVDTATGEMAHLFYDELGDVASYPSSRPLGNTGPFDNLQPYNFWYGTEYVPDANYVWEFLFDNGSQVWVNKDGYWYAWAVRPGDRSTSVPEPSTLLLLGSGIAGVIAWRRKIV